MCHRSGDWPLTLRVHDLTQFAQRGELASSGADAYVSFFTADGDFWETFNDWYMPLVIVTTIIVLFCCWSQENPAGKRSKRPRGHNPYRREEAKFRPHIV